MSVFKQNSRHLRGVLIFCFHLKKTAAEAHQMLSTTYSEAALSEITCSDAVDLHGVGKENIFGDSELETLLAGDSCQVQEELAESLGVAQQAISKRFKAMGMIQKQANWVPYTKRTKRR